MAMQFQFPQRGGTPGYGSAPSRRPPSAPAAFPEGGSGRGARLPPASSGPGTKSRRALRPSGPTGPQGGRRPEATTGGGWRRQGVKTRPAEAGAHSGRSYSGEPAKFVFAVGPGPGGREGAGTSEPPGPARGGSDSAQLGGGQPPTRQGVAQLFHLRVGRRLPFFLF